MNLKRYWLFLYQQESPSGGLGDLHQTSDSLQECRTFVKRKQKMDILFEIFDSVEQRIIETNISDNPKSDTTLYKWLNREQKASSGSTYRSMLH